MRLLLAFGFLVFIIQCQCLPLDVNSGDSRTDDTLLSAALTRVKKNADSMHYVEECTFVDSWQEQPGFINVLAFLDASWEYSHRQATMLKMLQGRLERSGITGIKFFVINSSEPEAAVNKLDVEDEKEAWEAAEPVQNHNQTFSEIQQTREALKNKIDPDIAFVQDSDHLKIWEKLSASRDQVIVIDKCGRLSYRVIVPWSILHFPYVKAAILSTYKEQPCGNCAFESTTATEETESHTEKLAELLPEDLTISQMKEIAVKTYNLDQTDNTPRKIYHGKEPQDIPENFIQLLNKTASAKQEEAKINSNHTTEHKPLLLMIGDSNFDDSNGNRYSQASNSGGNNSDDNAHEDLSVTDHILSVTESTTVELDSDSSSTIINDSVDGIESTTDNTVESEMFNCTERIGNDHEANYSESTELPGLENTSEHVEESLVQSSTSGNSKTINTTFDSEDSNTSASSSSEESDNQIHKTVTTSSEDSESKDYVMPIRIIMHAPHIHTYEEPIKKYEYLVLKFGQPEYHGHLEPDSDYALNADEASFESDDQTGEENEDKENDEAELGSGKVDGQENRRHRHRGSGHKHKERRIQNKDKHLDSVFDKDESPGFYGEDVEYWRNYGNGDYQGELQIEQPNENTEQQENTDEETGVYNTTSIAGNNTSFVAASENDTINKEGTSRFQNPEMIQGPSEEMNHRKELPVDQQANNTKEDEKANHLFIHYSKLIPWLDYVFDQ